VEAGAAEGAGGGEGGKGHGAPGNDK
jgi:hypothetical protein